MPLYQISEWKSSTVLQDTSALSRFLSFFACRWSQTHPKFENSIAICSPIKAPHGCRESPSSYQHNSLNFDSQKSSVITVKDHLIRYDTEQSLAVFPSTFRCCLLVLTSVVEGSMIAAEMKSMRMVLALRVQSALLDQDFQRSAITRQYTTQTKLFIYLYLILSIHHQSFSDRKCRTMQDSFMPCCVRDSEESVYLTLTGVYSRKEMKAFNGLIYAYMNIVSLIKEFLKMLYLTSTSI